MFRALRAALLAAPIVASSASFDCNKAVTPLEKMICTNKELSRLDDTLGEIYKLELDSETITNLQSSQKA